MLYIFLMSCESYEFTHSFQTLNVGVLYIVSYMWCFYLYIVILWRQCYQLAVSQRLRNSVFIMSCSKNKLWKRHSWLFLFYTILSSLAQFTRVYLGLCTIILIATGYLWGAEDGRGVPAVAGRVYSPFWSLYKTIINFINISNYLFVCISTILHIK